MSDWFVVPDLDGPTTGGTRYNAALLAALAAEHATALPLTLDEARAALAAGRRGRYWVDSLYLGALPELRLVCPPDSAIGLLVHYLPSLVVGAGSGSPVAPSSAETAALERADAFVVPSAWLGQEISRRIQGRPILVVEPGCEVRPAETQPALAGVRAILVANLTENKGVLALLRALGDELLESDRFELEIVGSDTLEPAYAAECGRFVHERVSLRRCVTFAGELRAGAAEARLYLANLALSSSLLETYGMALSEARAAGLPLIAREGGNVRAHVAVASGGELVHDAGELARVALALARHPDEHRMRIERARNWAFANPPRSWRDAARGFVAGLGGLGFP